MPTCDERQERVESRGSITAPLAAGIGTELSRQLQGDRVGIAPKPTYAPGSQTRGSGNSSREYRREIDNRDVSEVGPLSRMLP